MTPPADPYGIPENMMGTIPVEYFALLGRIVALAGLLEIQIAHLHSSLHTSPQATSFGLSSGTALNEMLRLLDGTDPIPARPTMDVAARGDVRMLVGQLQSAMYRRNELLHGPWTMSHDEQVYSWRPIPASQFVRDEKNPAANPTAGEYVAEDDLRSFLASLVSLVLLVQRTLPALEAYPRW